MYYFKEHIVRVSRFSGQTGKSQIVGNLIKAVSCKKNGVEATEMICAVYCYLKKIVWTFSLKRFKS